MPPIQIEANPPSNRRLLPHGPLPRVMPVIVSNEGRGAGTQSSAFRNVIRVHTPDGDLIAEADPLEHEHCAQAINRLRDEVDAARTERDGYKKDRLELATKLANQAHAFEEFKKELKKDLKALGRRKGFTNLISPILQKIGKAKLKETA